MGLMDLQIKQSKPFFLIDLLIENNNTMIHYPHIAKTDKTNIGCDHVKTITYS